MSPSTNSPAGMEEDAGGRWVSASVGPRGLRTEMRARKHTVVIDEPTEDGGMDAGPTPYEYLLGALSGCMAMTLRLYADRKGWPLEGIRVQLRTAASHESDCEHCETEKVGITRIDRRVELSGVLTDEQRKRLLEIADRCPVKQTLERGIRVQTVP